MFLFLQRVVCALCLVSLCGCSTSCRQWEIQQILTKTPCFNGGRLLLAPDSEYSRIELEIIRNRSGIRFYINLLFLEAPPCPEDKTRTSLNVLFQDQEPWIIYPYLFTGGQRLLLPGDAADVLIQALLDEESFDVEIGRSRIKVIPDNFSIVYTNFLSLPIDEDPN